MVSQSAAPSHFEGFEIGAECLERGNERLSPLIAKKKEKWEHLGAMKLTERAEAVASPRRRLYSLLIALTSMD